MRLQRAFHGLGVSRMIGVLLTVTAACCMAASPAAATGVINTITVEDPIGVSSDGTHAWVTNYGQNTVSEINTSTHKVEHTITVGSEPYEVSSDGTHAWVTNKSENTVSEINTSTHKVEHTIPVGSEPEGVSSDGTHAWVTNRSENTVSEINTSTHKVEHTIPVGEGPYGVSSDGTHVWVTNDSENTVSEINTSTHEVEHTIPVGGGPVGVSSDGTHVWVTNYAENTVSEINVSTHEVEHTIPVGGGPVGVSSDGTHVWVTNYEENTVSEINASTHEVEHTITVGRDPWGVSSDGTHIWVTTPYDSTVVEIAINMSPTTTTGSPSSVSSVSATLSGTVNPNGLDTLYYFEYGKTKKYGNVSPEGPAHGDAGDGSSAVSVSTALTGLQPNTTYHYRLVATNSSGTSYGNDQTFKTWPVFCSPEFYGINYEGCAAEPTEAGWATVASNSAFGSINVADMTYIQPVVPTNCASNADGAIWVGLGMGGTSSQLAAVQAGVALKEGSAYGGEYGGWIQTFWDGGGSGSGVPVDFTATPGDHISVEILWDGGGNWEVIFIDKEEGQILREILPADGIPVANPGRIWGAQFLVETTTPSQPLALPPSGVTFTSNVVGENGVTQGFTSFAFKSSQMIKAPSSPLTSPNISVKDGTPKGQGSAFTLKTKEPCGTGSNQ